MINAGIIGRGNIGCSLLRKLINKPGWNIRFITDSKNIYRVSERKVDEEFFFENIADLNLDNLNTIYRGLDILFLAIPSDIGYLAMVYAYLAAKKGIRVVTCEKGMLSEHFTDIAPLIGRIGFSATVGGGTMMLPEMRKRISLPFVCKLPAIYSVINGTLNFLFSGGCLDEAIKTGLVEPRKEKEKDPIQEWIRIINSEIEDTARKAVIIHNTVIDPSHPIRLQNIRITPVKRAEEFDKIADNYRYFVMFIPERSPEFLEKSDKILAFNEKIGNLSVIGGFFAPGFHEMLDALIIPGANNAFIMDSPYDQYREIFPHPFGGPGAGAEPTADAMIKDALYLLNKKLARK